MILKVKGKAKKVISFKAGKGYHGGMPFYYKLECGHTVTRYNDQILDRAESKCYCYCEKCKVE